MKKTYETMEAYKVCFNANEQIAAAACVSYELNGRYTNAENVAGTCEAEIQGGNYVQKGTNAVLNNAAYWGTPGGADDKVRYQ